MAKKSVIREIDRIIKSVWKNELWDEYLDGYLLREDTLKCDLYHHLRMQLDDLLYENNLRIYTMG